jgi:hypothetical protein
MRIRRLAILALAAGAALTTATVVGVVPPAPALDFGGPAAIPTFASASPAVPSSVLPTMSASAPSAASAEPPGASSTARVPIRDGDLAAYGAEAAPAADAPARLRIPSLGVDAPVDGVGIDARSGEVAIPDRVSRVGWYRFGPGWSANAGSIVVAGHVDSAAEGKGAFFRLGDLKSGDTVTLTGTDGRDRAFEVVARERYRKTAIPLERYFARDGAVRLTLITCGGPFDEATRHYRDNVVVTATLVR